MKKKKILKFSFLASAFAGTFSIASSLIIPRSNTISYWTQNNDISLTSETAYDESQMPLYSATGLVTDEYNAFSISNPFDPDILLPNYEEYHSGKTISVGYDQVMLLSNSGGSKKAVSRVSANSATVKWQYKIPENQILNSIQYVKATNTVFILTRSSTENKIFITRLDFDNGRVKELSDGSVSKTIEVHEGFKNRAILSPVANTGDRLILAYKAIESGEVKSRYSYEIKDKASSDPTYSQLTYNTITDASRKYNSFSISAIEIKGELYIIEFTCWEDEHNPEFRIFSKKGLLGSYRSTVSFVTYYEHIWKFTMNDFFVKSVKSGSDDYLQMMIPYSYWNDQKRSILLTGQFNLRTKEWSKTATHNFQLGPDFDMYWSTVHYNYDTYQYGDIYSLMNYTKPTTTDFGKTIARFRTSDWDVGDGVDDLNSYKWTANKSTNRLFLYRDIASDLYTNSVLAPLPNKTIMVYASDENKVIAYDTSGDKGKFLYDTGPANGAFNVGDKSTIDAREVTANEVESWLPENEVKKQLSIWSGDISDTRVTKADNQTNESTYEGSVDVKLSLTGKAWNNGTAVENLRDKPTKMGGFRKWETDYASFNRTFPSEGELSSKKPSEVTKTDIVNFIWEKRAIAFKDLPLDADKDNLQVVTIDPIGNTNKISFTIRLNGYVDANHKYNSGGKDFSFTISNLVIESETERLPVISKVSISGETKVLIDEWLKLDANVVMEGNAPVPSSGISYEWYKIVDGESKLIPGATFDKYSTSASKEINGMGFQVKATYNGKTVESDIVTVSVSSTGSSNTTTQEEKTFDWWIYAAIGGGALLLLIIIIILIIKRRKRKKEKKQMERYNQGSYGNDFLGYDESLDDYNYGVPEYDPFTTKSGPRVIVPDKIPAPTKAPTIPTSTKGQTLEKPDIPKQSVLGKPAAPTQRSSLGQSSPTRQTTTTIHKHQVRSSLASNTQQKSQMASSARQVVSKPQSRQSGPKSGIQKPR